VAAATAAVRAAVVPPPPRPAVTGRITVAHAAGGLPSLVTIAVFPAGAPRGSELLFSIFQPGGGAVNRRVLEPASPGVYREEYRFPAPGAYGFYMRFGAGQSGFVAAGAIGIGAAPGTLDEVTTRFRSGLRKAPGYVQPLGYTIFGLIAALAIAGMAAVLARIRGTLSA
jgi:hypothetical protein